MTTHSLIVGIFVGNVLLAFGLIPGLLDGLAEAFIEELQNFRDSMWARVPVTPRRHSHDEILRRPWGLAAAGALLITISILSYLGN